MKLKSWKRNIKRKIYKWLMPDDDYRKFMMYRVYEKQVATVSTQVVLNNASYDFVHSGKGNEKYDVVYGLTRQLADELKDYVKYKESYDPMHDEWTCRVDLKVVK